MKRKNFSGAVTVAAVLLLTAVFTLQAVSGQKNSGATKVKLSRRTVPATWHIEGLPEQAKRISWQIYLAEDAPVQKLPVLVLVSGWTCGAGWLDGIARYLAANRFAEVWTVNRRWTAWENRPLFMTNLQRAVQLQSGPAFKSRVLKLLGRPQQFARWKLSPLRNFGLIAAAHDLYQVVSLAAQSNRRVFLGGWSDGVEYVMTTMLLKPAGQKKRGHKLLSGALLLDENPEWGKYTAAVQRYSLTKYQRRLKDETVEARYPPVTVFSAAGMLTNRISPLAQLFPRLPLRRYRWQGDALLGWLYDGGGYRSRWGWLFRSGQLSPGRDGVIRWKNGEMTPVEAVRQLHTGTAACWEWFYPLRVAADYWELGVRGMRWKQVAPDRSCRTPLLAVYSSFVRFRGRLAPGLRWFLRRTGIRPASVKALRSWRFAHGDLLVSPAAGAVYQKIGKWMSAVLQQGR